MAKKKNRRTSNVTQSVEVLEVGQAFHTLAHTYWFTLPV